MQEQTQWFLKAPHLPSTASLSGLAGVIFLQAFNALLFWRENERVRQKKEKEVKILKKKKCYFPLLYWQFPPRCSPVRATSTARQLGFCCCCCCLLYLLPYQPRNSSQRFSIWKRGSEDKYPKEYPFRITWASASIFVFRMKTSERATTETLNLTLFSTTRPSDNTLWVTARLWKCDKISQC